jgi:phosphoserine phosphatase
LNAAGAAPRDAHTDLVVQPADLPAEALAAFQLAFPRARLRAQSASYRLESVGSGSVAGRVAELSERWRCDATLVPSTLDLSAFRVLALDMDSTLLQGESVDELAARAGRGAEVAAITAAAMRGEISDYSESLRRRVAMLAGTDEEAVHWVAGHRLQLSPGAGRLVAAARRAGLRILLVTGGFGCFARPLQQRLGIDEVSCNELEVRDGRLTGEVSGPVRGAPGLVDAQGKSFALRRLCDELGCATDQAIAVGDGANDLPMLELAGLPVAYHAKPAVRGRIAYRLDVCGLDGLLQWFSAGVDEESPR